MEFRHTIFKGHFISAYKHQTFWFYRLFFREMFLYNLSVGLYNILFLKMRQKK